MPKSNENKIFRDDYEKINYSAAGYSSPEQQFALFYDFKY